MKLFAALLLLCHTGLCFGSFDSLLDIVQETEFSVERQILKAGFHRSLEVSISGQFPESLDSKLLKCRFGLVQTLPATMYIDIDEISDMIRLDVPGAVNVSLLGEKNYIDVERPTDASSAHEVVMIFKDHAQWNASLLFDRAVVPFHLRYQSPGMELYRKATLPSPTVCLMCHNEDKKSVLAHTSFDRCSDAMSADWEAVNKILDPHSNEIQISVPVGELKRKNTVEFVTLGITSMGSILLTYKMIKMKTL